MSTHRFTLRLPDELFDAVAATAGEHRRPVAEEMRALLRAQLFPETITRKQSAALHARANQLDRALDSRPGRSKEEALRAVSETFGREITSSAALSVDEASYVLDWLRERLEA